MDTGEGKSTNPLRSVGTFRRLVLADLTRHLLNRCITDSNALGSAISIRVSTCQLCHIRCGNPRVTVLCSGALLALPRRGESSY